MDMLENLLNSWGADPAGAVRRLMDDSVFYRRLLKEYAQNPALWELVAQVGEGNYQEATIAAHSLKGAAANLGLCPLMERLEAVVKDLRTDPEKTELRADMKQFMIERDRFLEIMRQAY